MRGVPFWTSATDKAPTDNYEDDEFDDDEKGDNDNLTTMTISTDNDIAILPTSYEKLLPNIDVIQYIRMKLLHWRVISKYRIGRFINADMNLLHSRVMSSCSLVVTGADILLFDALEKNSQKLGRCESLG